MENRCEWSGTDPLDLKYHDDEWGVPLHDDRGLFELLTLEGAQAGLSWLTILRKRDNYRKALHGCDPQKIAGYSATDLERLFADPGIDRVFAEKIVEAVRTIRGLDLKKKPCVSETVDWTRSLIALQMFEIKPEVIQGTLNVLCKSEADAQKVREHFSPPAQDASRSD